MATKWTSIVRSVCWTGLVIVACATAASRAEDACGGFTWNVAHEQALFAGAPTAGSAGVSSEQAPPIASGKLYDLTLTAQEQVHFAVAPGKKALADGAYGGLVRFKVPATGLYRISLDQPFWIDVVAGGKLVPSKDFQGRPGCSAPHKIVEFALPANQELLLQFSNAVSTHVRVTVTEAAASTKS
jgi:hypothetical protein